VTPIKNSQRPLAADFKNIPVVFAANMYSPQVSIKIRSQPCNFQHRSGNKRKKRFFLRCHFFEFPTSDFWQIFNTTYMAARTVDAHNLSKIAIL